MAIYKKPVGYSVYTPNKVINLIEDGFTSVDIEGMWQLARPEPYFSFRERLQQAWDVLTYKADALYWREIYNRSSESNIKSLTHTL